MAFKFLFGDNKPGSLHVCRTILGLDSVESVKNLRESIRKAAVQYKPTRETFQVTVLEKKKILAEREDDFSEIFNCTLEIARVAKKFTRVDLSTIMMMLVLMEDKKKLLVFSYINDLLYVANKKGRFTTEACEGLFGFKPGEQVKSRLPKFMEALDRFLSCDTSMPIVEVLFRIVEVILRLETIGQSVGSDSKFCPMVARRFSEQVKSSKFLTKLFMSPKKFVEMDLLERMLILMVLEFFSKINKVCANHAAQFRECDWFAGFMGNLSKVVSSEESMGFLMGIGESTMFMQTFCLAEGNWQFPKLSFQRSFRWVANASTMIYLVGLGRPSEEAMMFPKFFDDLYDIVVNANFLLKRDIEEMGSDELAECWDLIITLGAIAFVEWRNTFFKKGAGKKAVSTHCYTGKELLFSSIDVQLDLAREICMSPSKCHLIFDQHSFYLQLLTRLKFIVDNIDDLEPSDMLLESINTTVAGLTLLRSEPVTELEKLAPLTAIDEFQDLVFSIYSKLLLMPSNVKALEVVHHILVTLLIPNCCATSPKFCRRFLADEDLFPLAIKEPVVLDPFCVASVIRYAQPEALEKLSRKFSDRFGQLALCYLMEFVGHKSKCIEMACNSLLAICAMGKPNPIAIHPITKLFDNFCTPLLREKMMELLVVAFSPNEPSSFMKWSPGAFDIFAGEPDPQKEALLRKVAVLVAGVALARFINESRGSCYYKPLTRNDGVRRELAAEMRNVLASFSGG